MSQLLESRWSETKEALLEGLQGNKRSVMATTLENTRKYLAESATAGATSAGNVATLNRVILPVIRRVMPTVIANELVGVQPMTGPVGQIHAGMKAAALLVVRNGRARGLKFVERPGGRGEKAKRIEVRARDGRGLDDARQRLGRVT